MRPCLPRSRLKSRLLRATSAGLCLALAAGPAGAQLRPGAADRAKELNAQAGNADAKAAVSGAANAAARTGDERDAPFHWLAHGKVLRRRLPAATIAACRPKCRSARWDSRR